MEEILLLKTSPTCIFWAGSQIVENKRRGASVVLQPTTLLTAQICSTKTNCISSTKVLFTEACSVNDFPQQKKKTYFVFALNVYCSVHHLLPRIPNSCSCCSCSDRHKKRHMAICREPSVVS